MQEPVSLSSKEKASDHKNDVEGHPSLAPKLSNLSLCSFRFVFVVVVLTWQEANTPQAPFHLPSSSFVIKVIIIFFP